MRQSGIKKSPRVKTISSKARNGVKLNKDEVKALNLEWDIWHHDQTFIAKYFLQRCWKDKRKFDYFDGNIMAIDKPGAPCFVAHMDTVSDKSMDNQIMLEGGILYREDAILGADDRAGVQIVWDVMDDVNFILTRDEEIGGVGASSVAETPFVKDKIDEMKVPCFFEFDRMNAGDIIGVFNSYCDTSLSDDIQALAPTYTDAQGVFTDIDKLTALGIQGVNLSVGYYQQHSKAEYLNLTEYTNARELAKTLAKEFTDSEPYVYEEDTAPYYSQGLYYSPPNVYTGTVKKKKPADPHCSKCGVYLVLDSERKSGVCQVCSDAKKATGLAILGTKDSRSQCSNCSQTLFGREHITGLCYDCTEGPLAPVVHSKIPTCDLCQIELLHEEEAKGRCNYCNTVEDRYMADYGEL